MTAVGLSVQVCVCSVGKSHDAEGAQCYGCRVFLWIVIIMRYLIDNRASKNWIWRTIRETGCSLLSRDVTRRTSLRAAGFDLQMNPDGFDIGVEL
jgi:hypothetical protein